MARYSRISAGSDDQTVERPSDHAVRKANLRRALRLFVPYKTRQTAVGALIGISALIGLVPPFLLREVLDEALPDQNGVLLTWLVLGMIAAAIATGVIGVYQTLLSNQVGQRVMHDLRTAV